MSQLTGLGPIDLLVILLIAGTVAGTLIRRRGLLAAAGRAAVVGLACWVGAAAALAWAPATLSSTVANSTFVHIAPAPVHALTGAVHLVTSTFGRSNVSNW